MYIRPVNFVKDMGVNFVKDIGVCHSISVLAYHESPLQKHAPNYSSTIEKRVSERNTYYYDDSEDQGILRRAHKNTTRESLRSGENEASIKHGI